MAEIVSRRKVMRACKSRGWMVQSTALTAIHNYLNLLDKDCLEDVLQEMSQHVDKHTKLITESLWKEIMEANESTSLIKEEENIELVNAFNSPRLSYDSMRKTFRVEEKQWPLLGTVADKINMMAQRYALVHQRTLRHDLFRKSAKSKTYQSSQADIKIQQHTLTPIESLLGKQDSDHLPVVVLGILTQVEEGQFYLEDPTGQVRVSFNRATAVDGFYITENSILLVEATFQDEILHVDRVGSPFPEQREKTLQILQQQVRHPHFIPISSQAQSSSNGSVVVLSDVYLDQPRVLTMLEDMFKPYESSPASEMPVFCIMGNFTSNPHASAHQGFEELAMLISKFPSLAKHANFIFIPGPNDSDCGILPQAPLVQETLGLQRTMQSYQIEHVHWGSNPCRVRQNDKELVLFRFDVLAWMLQNQVRMPHADGMTDRTPHSRMAKTILDQTHLLPVARAPIYWNCDHALRLYPLPDALVMGGSTSEEDYEVYQNCDTIHPGSFSKNGKYAVYFPSRDLDDAMSVDTEDQGNNSKVRFSQGAEI